MLSVAIRVSLPGMTDLGIAEYGDRIADVYDDWYAPAAAEPMIAAAAAFLAEQAAGGPALELGVGTGRLALPLVALGVPVVGIDASTRMLERARAKAAAAAAASRPGGAELVVVTGDFADADAPGDEFSLVFVAFNTLFMLTSQDEQARCFANVAAALRPGGVFVVEAFVPDPTRWDRGQRTEVVGLADASTRLLVSMHDPVSQRTRGQHVVLDGTGTWTYPFEMRYAWPAELDLMARLAGLEPAGRWGGWSGQPFTATSPSHVSVWRKPAASAVTS